MNKVSRNPRNYRYLEGADRLQRLREAQRKANALCAAAQQRGYFRAGQTERQLSDALHALANELFGLERHWHKRIVRTGENTLCPYQERPADRLIEADDILFVDFGPVFGEWEADIGRTFVVGDDPIKHRLCAAARDAWYEGLTYFQQRAKHITGAELYAFTTQMAHRLGWTYGGPHCGHLIGNFPHELVQGDELENYIHPANHKPMAAPDDAGRERHWIFEIHLVDRVRRIGAFFEQLLDPDVSAT